LNNTPPQNDRLRIIHLLGWMLGCSLALAMQRAQASSGPLPLPLVLSVSRLVLGLAYGTALSGLGLFLWRWRTQSGPGPTQPGHWLLIYGGVRFLIVFFSGATVKLVTHVAPSNLLPWLFSQAISGWITTAIGIVFVLRIRDAPRLWKATAALIVLSIGLSTLESTNLATNLILQSRGVRNVYFPLFFTTLAIPVYFHMAKIGPVLWPVCMWYAVAIDRVNRTPRDWLHVSGVVAFSGLAIVNFGFSLRYFVSGLRYFGSSLQYFWR
jgi:hypothetical protein